MTQVLGAGDSLTVTNTGSISAVNPAVSVIAYGMVVLSLLVQGGLLLPIARMLRLRGDPAIEPHTQGTRR